MTAPMPSDAEIDQALGFVDRPGCGPLCHWTRQTLAQAVRGLRARGRAWYAEAADQNLTAQLDATRPVILAAIRLVDGITAGNSGSSALVKAVRDMAGDPAAAEYFDSAEAEPEEPDQIDLLAALQRSFERARTDQPHS